MAWLFLIPIIYLCLVIPVAVFRLFHRPRFRGACLSAIAVSLGVPLYMTYLFAKPNGTVLILVEIWIWLLASIPVQFVLLTLAFIPNKSQMDDPKEP